MGKSQRKFNWTWSNKKKKLFLGGGGIMNYVSCKLFLQKILMLYPVIYTNIGYNWTRKRRGVENVSIYFHFQIKFYKVREKQNVFCFFVPLFIFYFERCTTEVRLMVFWLFYINLCYLISINMISYDFTIWDFINI